MYLLCFQFIVSLDEVTEKLQEIGNLHSNLFNKNLTVKQWQANELRVIDSK